MNKVLRLLLFSGLAALFFTSCSKDMDYLDIPDGYARIDSLPFSLVPVPKEGCDSLFLYRIKKDDILKEKLDATDMTLQFHKGDSIILEAYPKSGYTFINWVRDGRGVSNDPIFGFKLDSLDIDTSKHFVKHHYEARFGLDYALQVIPPIDSVIPIELIRVMGPHLHFGDNPPKIESFSFDSLHLVRFIHNSDHPEIPYNPQTMYYQVDGQWYTTQFQFEYMGQHRGVYDSCYYVRNYGPLEFPNPQDFTLPPLVSYLSERATTNDSIFIMGNGNDFTIYYHQTIHRNLDPYIPSIAGYLNGGIDLTWDGSFIVSGTITDQGISDFHFGFRVERYNKPFNPAWVRLLPAIHDMFYLDYSLDNSNP